MEPAVIISTLSKLIGLGMAFHKAHRSEGFDSDDISAIKAFLDTGSGLLSSKTKDDKPVGAIQLALVVRAFGVAMGQHWANNERLSPGKSSLPLWVRKIFDGSTAKRFEEIELRVKHAHVKLLDPGTQVDPAAELRLLQQLTSQPESSPYYRALWSAFTNRKLDDEDVEPLLSLEKEGDAREFEKLFRLAYAKALATPEGQRVQQWQIELSEEKPRALQHALMLDMAGWGRRHVFGNSLEPAANDILPFMPLDDVYVEPFGCIAGKSGAEEKHIPIKTLIKDLLEQHHLVIVRADFGHGKSLTARCIAKDLATAWITDNFTSGPSLTVPVFIKCTRDIVESAYDHSRVIRRARWNHANDALRVNRPIDDDVFAPIEEQKILFILDGLDEIAFTSNQLRDLFRHLDEKARGGACAVVFTRPGALFHDCLPKGTPIVDLLPFQGREQIETWIHGWNCLAGPERKVEWEQIETAGLQALASTPILLLMIAMTTRDSLEKKDTTTIDKTVLYERFFRHIARGKLEQDGDQHGPIVRASKELRDRLIKGGILDESAEPVEAMLWLMSRVAWKAHDHAYRHEASSLSVKEVEYVILEHELGLKDDIRRVIEVGLVLAMQINPAEDSKDILFGHQSFREFLVARYWCHELLRLVGSRGRRKRDESITDHLREARLLQEEDASFSMLESMINRLRDDERRRIHEWAQEVTNDETLSGKTLRADRSSILRESALAIGSSIAPIELDDEMALRSLQAIFYARREILRLRAPGLMSPGAHLDSTDLQGADLRDANLQRAHLEAANLQLVSLRGADLQEADLRDADLQEADLENANLRSADLRNANLQISDLRGADLSGANLLRSDLQGADLSGANLQGAILQHANLQNATLKHADLRHADLRAADLRDADLRHADLQNADLRRSDLEDATFDSETAWPTGFQPARHRANSPLP